MGGDEQMRDVMRTPELVDGRNLFDEMCQAAGMIYRGVGKG